MARYPMVYLLVPLVAVILVCYYTGKPINLLRDTEADYLDTTRLLIAVVHDYPRECKRTVRCEAEVLAYKDTDRKSDGAVWRPNLLARQGKVYLYLMPDSTDKRRDKEGLMGLQIGDTLAVRTHIRRGGKLGDFDYGMYLRQQGIVGTGMVWRGNWRLLSRSGKRGRQTDAFFTVGETPASPIASAVRQGDRTSLGSIARQVQRGLYARYGEIGITGAEQATLGALTLGYKEDLDPALK